MPVLNAQAVGNAYPQTPGSGASLAQVWNAKGGWFSVTNAGAFVKLQYGGLGSEHWTDEILLGAGAFVVLPPNCIGMQFRNSVANAIATVTAQIAQGDEPPLAISSIGQTNVVSVASLNFQHGGVAVGTEPTLNLIDAAGVIAWTVADNGAQTRVDVTPAFTSPALFPGNVGVGGNAGDTTISRLAAGVLGISTAFSTGPTTDAAGGGGTAGIYHGASLNQVAAAAGTAVQQSSITTDTQPRYTQTAGGAISWGPGAAAALDTTLQRNSAGILQLGTTTQPGTLWLFGSAAASNELATFVTTDAQARWAVAADGTTTWGSGAGARDTTLQRNSAGILQLGTTAQPGTLWLFGSAAASNELATFVTTDAQARWAVAADGTMTWGSGAAARDVTLARTVNSPTGTGSFLELISGAGLGYGTGVGGTVSAASTSVTLNKPCGQVTYTGQANSASTTKTFTVTNSVVGADDVVLVSVNNASTFTGSALVSTIVGAGSFTIVFWNTTANASATFSFNFAVIKGAHA